MPWFWTEVSTSVSQALPPVLAVMVGEHDVEVVVVVEGTVYFAIVFAVLQKALKSNTIPISSKPDTGNGVVA